MVTGTDREAIIRKIAKNILDRDPLDKNFGTLFSEEFFHSPFIEDERGMVRVAVGSVLAGLRRRQTIRLVGSESMRRQANEHIV